MDYEEQQSQEIEALGAIYQEDEFEVECSEYPNISIRINLKSNQDSDDVEEHDFEFSLVIELPASYPDVPPTLKLDGLDELFSEERIKAVTDKLNDEANNNLGMVMVFTIVSALQDEVGALLLELKARNEEKAEQEKKKLEEVDRKKFEGTVVTPESFRLWKEKFDKERKVLMDKQEKEKQALLGDRLTGRQLFLKDATLCLSDVAMLDENVEIDESLFDAEDLEGLDLGESDED